jgi:proteasome lid subunit RPN8/RPN11
MMTGNCETITVLLRASLRDQILTAATAAEPDEACGLLLGIRETASARIESVVGLPNRTEQNPQMHYQIDPLDFLRLDREAQLRGLEVIGVWHSHPDGSATPSATDRALAWPDWCYLIAGRDDNGKHDLRAWRFRNDRTTEDRVTEWLP